MKNIRASFITSFLGLKVIQIGGKAIVFPHNLLNRLAGMLGTTSTLLSRICKLLEK